MKYINDCIGILGLGSLSYGLYLVNTSLALCVTGSVLIIFAVVAARNSINVAQ